MPTSKPAGSPALALPQVPGCYVLVLELMRPCTGAVGRLGTVQLPRGLYAYVGSARGGLARRVARYLRPVRALHWHIDYLLCLAPLRDIWLLTRATDECRLRRQLATLAGVAEGPVGFGCSDCRCPTHLLRVSRKGAGALARLLSRRATRLVLARLGRPTTMDTRARHAPSPVGDSGA